jgi:hypothetical protein
MGFQPYAGRYLTNFRDLRPLMPPNGGNQGSMNRTFLIVAISLSTHTLKKVYGLEGSSYILV